MRRTAPPRSAAAQVAPATAWQATYPGTPGQARRVRAALRAPLQGCPAADDVILLVNELAANAIAFSLLSSRVVIPR